MYAQLLAWPVHFFDFIGFSHSYAHPQMVRPFELQDFCRPLNGWIASRSARTLPLCRTPVHGPRLRPHRRFRLHVRHCYRVLILRRAKKRERLRTHRKVNRELCVYLRAEFGRLDNFGLVLRSVEGGLIPQWVAVFVALQLEAATPPNLRARSYVIPKQHSKAACDSM